MKAESLRAKTGSPRGTIAVPITATPSRKGLSDTPFARVCKLASDS